MTNNFGSRITGIRTKSDLVHERLRHAILDGQVLPGARMNVDEIARELGVSKIPVREALHKLEAEGLILQTAHVGARVASLSARELKGAFLIRAELEGLATRLAAQTITEPQLNDLRQLHEEMQEQYARGELTWMTQQNRKFHVLIARASGYSNLEQHIDQTLVSVIRYRSVIMIEPNAWKETLDQHADIIDALSERDEARAERAAILHVNKQLAVHILRHLDQMPD